MVTSDAKQVVRTYFSDADFDSIFGLNVRTSTSPYVFLAFLLASSFKCKNVLM